jgi:hypothetical protein
MAAGLAFMDSRWRGIDAGNWPESAEFNPIDWPVFKRAGKNFRQIIQVFPRIRGDARSSGQIGEPLVTS